MVKKLSYKKLLQQLFEVNLHSGMKLGLSNMERLNAALGNPIKKFASIHIAGTNGKGSVSTKIAKALEAEGYRVGLFTSPHISTFRERVKINSQMIDEESTASHLQRIFDLIKSEQIPATFFEITTALAFSYFEEQNVDYAVLEAGLGGRLDATNIVTPQLSVITSISLEHTEFLGHTLEEITTEKAGIIKPHVPVVIGPCVPPYVVEKIAKAKKAPLHIVTGHHIYFDEENRAIAKKSLEILGVKEKSIAAGLEALPPCRMEIVCQDPPVILDAGHNPDGLEHLFQALKQKYPHSSFRVLFGLSKTKDINGCLHVFKRFVDTFHLVEAPNGRGLEVDALWKKMEENYFEMKLVYRDGDIPHSIQKAMQAAQKNKQLLIVCGTFFIMSDARAALGIKETRDEYDTNEIIKNY